MGWFEQLEAQKQQTMGATAAIGTMQYPYSALSPQAKQAEDREAEIERIARLLAEARAPGCDPDILIVEPHYNFMRTPDGCQVIPENQPPHYFPVMPYWRTFYRAAEAVYEDRRK